MADLVFDVTGKNPLLEMALELERIALEDEYFVSRKLYPNVDFYSGLIYQAMGFPVDMFPVLFAIPRTAGWIAQWEEMLNDPDQKIARPRQIYLGTEPRDYVAEGEAPVTETGHGRGHDGHEDRAHFVVFVVIVTFVLAAVARCSAQARRQPQRRAASSTAPAPSRICGSRSSSGPGPPARRRSSRRATTSRSNSIAAGLTVEEQAVRRADARSASSTW